MSDSAAHASFDAGGASRLALQRRSVADIHAAYSALQRPALEDALRQLYILDCLDADGRITALGRRLAKLPLDPSLGRVLAAAAEMGCLDQALSLCAMLTAESIFLGSRRVRAV